jgi:UDP-N-acetylglucosamine 2-epimerase
MKLLFIIGKSGFKKSSNIRWIGWMGSTETSKEYLLREGIAEECIFVTGNTVVDAVFQHRENTERPETIEAGAMCYGTNPDEIVKGCAMMMGSSRVWENPYRDGTAGDSWDL